MLSPTAAPAEAAASAAAEDEADASEYETSSGNEGEGEASVAGAAAEEQGDAEEPEPEPAPLTAAEEAALLEKELYAMVDYDRCALGTHSLLLLFCFSFPFITFTINNIVLSLVRLLLFPLL